MNQRNNNPNQTDRRLLTVSDKDIFVTVQKALLVGIILKNQTRADREESLKELTSLVKTAGSNPTIVQTKRVDRIDPKTFIGKGSINDLEVLSKANDIDVVIFDCELNPNQQKELREIFQCDVVDRTGLILDIFALHAQSKEANLQVELAMSVYLKPRLAGLGKTLNQQGGGIGTRGPGEAKLETDSRLIDNRINKLRKEVMDTLEDLSSYNQVTTNSNDVEDSLFKIDKDKKVDLKSGIFNRFKSEKQETKEIPQPELFRYENIEDSQNLEELEANTQKEIFETALDERPYIEDSKQLGFYLTRNVKTFLGLIFITVLITRGFRLFLDSIKMIIDNLL